MDRTPPPPNSVFVGNLSFATTTEELANLFSAVGKVYGSPSTLIITSCSRRIATDIVRRGNRSLGYGFVTFATQAEAQQAAVLMNKKELRGRVINVELVQQGDHEQTLSKEPRAMRPGSLYTYVALASVSPRLICAVCLEPFVEPRRTPCRHTFCKSCIANLDACPTCRGPIRTDTLQEPDQTLLDFLGELLVVCTHRDRGCQWQGPRENLTEHLQRTCLHTSVSCTSAHLSCSWKGSRYVHSCAVCAQTHCPSRQGRTACARQELPCRGTRPVAPEPHHEARRS